MCSKARSGFGNTPCPNSQVDGTNGICPPARPLLRAYPTAPLPYTQKDRHEPVLFLFHLLNTLQGLNHIHPANHRSHDKVYDEGKAHGKQAGIEIGGGVDAPGKHHHISFHRI